MIARLFKSEDGQSLVEYSLIISLVVLAAISGLILYGQQLITLYDSNKNNITDKLGGK